MATSPSKLEPHREFIAEERQKRTTYRRIAELLAQKGVQVDYSTIHAFVKVRSKPPRKVITMLKIRASEATQDPTISDSAREESAANLAQTAPPEQSGQQDAIRRLKEAQPAKRGRSKGLPSFQEDAPLERLSEEEARRLRKEL